MQVTPWEKTMQRIYLYMIALFLTLSSYASAQGPGSWPGMMGPGMMGWGYGMGWFGWIFMIVFWIAVIGGVVLLVRWIGLPTDKGRGPQSQESALDILKKRYAKGEISKEEYERIKKDIQ
jgi:putative membrane protein